MDNTPIEPGDRAPRQPRNFDWQIKEDQSPLVDAALPRCELQLNHRKREELEIGLIVRNLLDSLPPHLADIDAWFGELPTQSRRFRRSLMEQLPSFELAGEYGPKLAAKGMSPETIFQSFRGLKLLFGRLTFNHAPDRPPQLGAGDPERFTQGLQLSPEARLTQRQLENLVQSEIRGSIANLYADHKTLQRASEIMSAWVREVLREGVPLLQ